MEHVQDGNCDRNSPSFAVALNCGTGSSSLKALVNAFDKLHIVRERTSTTTRGHHRRATGLLWKR